MTRVGQPSVGRTERRVARKWQLAYGSEYSHQVVGGPVGRREDKGRFGQVRPCRRPLHVLVGDARRLEHDAYRVPEVGGVGKNVHLHEGSGSHPRLLCPPFGWSIAAPRFASSRQWIFFMGEYLREVTGCTPREGPG